MNTPALPRTRRRARLGACLIAALALAACEADLQPRAGDDDDVGELADAGDDGSAPGTAGGAAVDVDGAAPDTAGGAEAPDAGPPGTASGNGSYTLRASSRSLGIVEGGDAVTVSIELGRQNGYDLPVTLALEGASDADADDLDWSFADERLFPGETATELTLALGIGTLPLPADTRRTLTVIGTDGTNAPVTSEIVLDVVPTEAPDVYLLAGQSNMDGFSQLDARMAGAGEPDAPDPRIFQLNVTGNDGTNFASPADFTDPASIVADPAYTLALDPLHDGFDVGADGKAGRRIGPGLSFAKAMLDSTTADIVLVPAAWPDTGFCSRDTNLFEDLGWLAAPRAGSSFAGTLLHDRAVARASYAVERLGGVLRGILWHQGEAEVGDPVCARAYADNLAAMVESFRTNIAPGARGSAARGAGAPIPFVVGTMSKGADARGSQLPFIATKEIVDAVHRNVADVVPFSTFVDNDDLVPPAYPCGEGSCVHFGAAAQREMGARYAERLRSLAGG